MQRDQLIALLDDARSNNGDVPDFRIEVPRTEMGAVLMTLVYFKGSGKVTGYDRADPPDDCCIDITGYNG